MKVVRSPLYYLGDKYKIFEEISQYFPDDVDKFYDIFGGGGTMLANVNAKKIVYNDINNYVKNLLETFYVYDQELILSEIKKIDNKFNLTDSFYSSKEEFKNNYNDLKKYYNTQKDKNSFDNNILLFMLIIHGFNSQVRFNSKGKFNIPVGKQIFNNKRLETFKSFLNIIKNKEIYFKSEDFSFIEKIEIFSRNDFFYFDPPYLITDATYNSNWKEQDEIRLLDILDNLSAKKIKWALSNVFFSKGKENSILRNWSKKYNIYVINSSYSNSNYQRKNRDFNDMEVLITNYEIKRI